MKEMEIRRTITNKLAGLRYNVAIMRDGTINVKSSESYESIERMKRNIITRIPNAEFIHQRSDYKINYSKMTTKHGLPAMGQEEIEYTVMFKWKGDN